MRLSEGIISCCLTEIHWLGGETINKIFHLCSFYLFSFLYWTQTLLHNGDGIASDYGLDSLNQISLWGGKNNVLSVTNEKLHTWSASCDSDLSWRNRKWTMISHYLSYNISSFTFWRCKFLNECMQISVFAKHCIDGFVRKKILLYSTDTKGLNTHNTIMLIQSSWLC